MCCGYRIQEDVKHFSFDCPMSVCARERHIKDAGYISQFGPSWYCILKIVIGLQIVLNHLSKKKNKIDVETYQKEVGDIFVHFPCMYIVGLVWLILITGASTTKTVQYHNQNIAGQVWAICRKGVGVGVGRGGQMLFLAAVVFVYTV